MKRYFIKHLALFLILTLAGCRYDDGPFISLRSAKKRLTAPWRPLEIYKDGNAVTFNMSVGQDLWFKDDGAANMISIGEPLLYPKLSGNWEFKDHKKIILITLTDSTYGKSGNRVTVSIDPVVVEWRILRLKRKPLSTKEYGYGKGELWVEEERADGTYEFRFDVTDIY